MEEHILGMTQVLLVDLVVVRHIVQQVLVQVVVILVDQLIQ